MSNPTNREPSKKGGSRPGAGRPAKPPAESLTRYMVRLRPEQIEWLRGQENASALLRSLIDNHFKNPDNEKSA